MSDIYFLILVLRLRARWNVLAAVYSYLRIKSNVCTPYYSVRCENVQYFIVHYYSSLYYIVQRYYAVHITLSFTLWQCGALLDAVVTLANVLVSVI